jgi:DNA replication protein DnaC
MTITCKNCQAEADVPDPQMVLGVPLGTRYLCDQCEAIRLSELEAEGPEKERIQQEAKNAANWQYVNEPDEIKETDVSMMSKDLVKIVTEWDPCSKIGIGFQGQTGKGKTRAAWIALRRACDMGLTVAEFRHVDFPKTVVAAATARDDAEREEATRLIYRYNNCGVLLIDDLGKAKSSEASDGEIYAIIDERKRRKRPILWTANAGSDWLAARFGEDRGEPIVRRLSEFSTIVEL